MRTYEIGKKYEFIVKYFYKDGDDESREKTWFSLSDGENYLKYNVPAYPYQENGWEGKTIVCIVTKVCDNGYPYLLQERESVLSNYYVPRETYWFSVIERKFDSNQQPYYKLLDRVQGISHRFYSDRDLEGLVGFTVRGIKTDNTGAHLELNLAEAGDQEAPALQVAEPVEHRNNPFGHEDEHHEWKSSLVFPPDCTDPSNPDVETQVLNIMKSIAGFQNAEGGLLYIGVTDFGRITGIEKDYPFLNSSEGDDYVYRPTTDGYELKIRQAVTRYLGNTSLDNISFKFYQDQATHRIFCIIIISKTPRVIFRKGREVFKRFGNGNRQLFGDDISDLVKTKLDGKEAQTEFTYPMPDNCQEYRPNRHNAPDNALDEPNEVIRLSNDFINKVDYYHMTFFSDNTLMYTKESHANDEGVISEVVFNKIDGNLEYSRDLLVKCSSDGHAKFLSAYDVCKLGNPDERIELPKCDIYTVKVAHKYDFIKVCFTNGTENREKYIRVVSLFGQDTESDLRKNKDTKTIKYECGLKGNSMVPSGCTLTGVTVIHENLPDEILFVSAKGGQGNGVLVGGTDIDVSSY